MWAKKIKSGIKSAYFIWSKLSAAQWEDAWQERLGWLGQRLVIFVLSGFKTIRIEAHQLSDAEAKALKKEFGGSVRKSKPMTMRDMEPKARKPLAIRRELVVVGTLEDRKKQNRPCIVIPAGMAFGTGEHATTATCLRLIVDFSKQVEGKWEALDIGTGSGILAFAAKRMGAARVDAADFDPAAVRVAKENAKVNGIEHVKIQRMDVLKWEPRREWKLVLANVYGPILIEAADQITRAVASDGRLILSGILREQEQEVLKAFRLRAIKFERVLRVGKWITAIGSR